MPQNSLKPGRERNTLKQAELIRLLDWVRAKGAEATSKHTQHSLAVAATKDLGFTVHGDNFRTLLKHLGFKTARQSGRRRRGGTADKLNAIAEAIYTLAGDGFELPEEFTAAFPRNWLSLESA